MHTRHHAHWPQRLPRSLSGIARPATLHAALYDAAQRPPDKTLSLFYLLYGARLDYAEVVRQADVLAGWLLRTAGFAVQVERCRLNWLWGMLTAKAVKR